MNISSLYSRYILIIYLNWNVFPTDKRSTIEAFGSPCKHNFSRNIIINASARFRCLLFTFITHFSTLHSAWQMFSCNYWECICLYGTFSYHIQILFQCFGLHSISSVQSGHFLVENFYMISQATSYSSYEVPFHLVRCLKVFQNVGSY